MYEDIIIPVAGMFTAIVIVTVSVYTKYRLKVEQIKADAMVRAEEVRAKNQLEMEKLMYSERTRSNNNTESGLNTDERAVREKVNE